MFSSCLSVCVEVLLARQFTWTVLKRRLQFVLFVSFISRRSSSRETVHVECSQEETSICSLRVFHFTLKFSSRGSSPWTVLKGRLQSSFVSFILRLISPRETVHRELSSRGDFNFFSSSCLPFCGSSLRTPFTVNSPLRTPFCQGVLNADLTVEGLACGYFFNFVLSRFQTKTSNK